MRKKYRKFGADVARISRKSIVATKNIDRDLKSEQFQFVDKGGSDCVANTACIKSAQLKARRIEVINGKTFLVVS